MTRAATIARVLAILIALLGVLDPALTSLRATRADISIVAPNRADSGLARRVAERLDNRYIIVRGPFANAAATVVVGHSLPDRIPEGPIYGVVDHGAPWLVEFGVPASVPQDSRLPVTFAWFGMRDNRRPELRANGVVVDTGPSDASIGRQTFTVTAGAPGPLLLQARAHADGQTLTADALTNVVDQPHAVLFFDRRPSWMSTFVRRSLELDRRFAVASRVITSRGVSTDAGQPPSTLADPALLELYDVIVVGAPALLSAADVAGLEQFLTKRGGAVVLLYDETPAQGIHNRLTGVTRWMPATLRTPVPACHPEPPGWPAPGQVQIPRSARDDSGSARDDSGCARGMATAVRATEVAWPAVMPITADERATATIADRERALVWMNGLGAGQVIVNGALDAWKFRDRATSGFDEFWRATISRAAREAGEAVTVDVTPNVLEPGERMTVRVTLRDTSARPVVMLDSTKIDVWPGERTGEFTTRLRAPDVGDHWVRASAGGMRAEAPVAVRTTVSRASRNELGTIETLARATGGVAGSLDDVERAIQANVVGERRMERWWPMRSAWWVVPFTGLLGFEWLARRRKGLA